MSLYTRINTLKQQPETARVGVKWTEAENEQLMKEVIDGMALDDVAKKHQRTVSGVKSRVMTNALNMMKDRDLTIEDVAKLVHISAEDLENHKQRQDEKAIAPKVKKIETKVEEPTPRSNDNVSYQYFMSVLTEIRDYLKIIAEK